MLAFVEIAEIDQNKRNQEKKNRRFLFALASAMSVGDAIIFESESRPTEL